MTPKERCIKFMIYGLKLNKLILKGESISKRDEE